MHTLDPTVFESTLVDELRAAWGTLRLHRPKDHFYSFGVYTTSLGEYISVAASTEEGLGEVADLYAQKYGGTPDLLKASLRWSPCDSPLHSEGNELLPRSSRLREAGPSPYDESEEAEAATALVFEASVRALKRLDQEGLFGQGEERERLVLSIWMGDQADEDRIRFARALNSQSIADRFALEMEQGLRAFRELSDARN